MDQDAFLNGLADVLRMEGGIVQPDLELDPDTWDSMAVMECIALIDEMAGITLPAGELAGCRSVGQLLDLIRDKLDA